MKSLSRCQELALASQSALCPSRRILYSFKCLLHLKRC